MDSKKSNHVTELPAIKLWHGSQRFSGNIEVKPTKRSQVVCGPGIYMTTSLSTAIQYAKGGGAIIEMSLSPDTRWMKGVKIDVNEMKAWVKNEPLLRKKKELIHDLELASEVKGDAIPASYLVNLCVNHESLTAQNGPSLAAWLTEHSCDAVIEPQGLNEQWVLVFNPKIVIAHKQISTSNIRGGDYDLPFINIQLADIENKRNLLAQVNHVSENIIKRSPRPR